MVQSLKYKFNLLIESAQNSQVLSTPCIQPSVLLSLTLACALLHWVPPPRCRYRLILMCKPLQTDRDGVGEGDGVDSPFYTQSFGAEPGSERVRLFGGFVVVLAGSFCRVCVFLCLRSLALIDVCWLIGSLIGRFGWLVGGEIDWLNDLVDWLVG